VAPLSPVWTISSVILQDTLPADTLLLEFFATDEKLLVFGLMQEQMWTRTLPLPRSTLNHLLNQLYFQMNKFSYGASYRERHAAALLTGTNDVLNTLYTELLAPLPDIHLAHHIVVIPHGVLHYIPFHALRHDGHYLIESQAISYAPSATIFHRVLMSRQHVPSDSPLIMGINDSTIPHVEEEVKGVKQLFPSAQVYLGTEATTSRLLAERRQAPFLHISTHALFRQDNPNFSSLKLADGWLTVNEIYHLTTTAPLVTLSACETGRSDVAPGDELIGLCRGFFGTGAQSLVVSLWRVEDRSTAALMVQFYKGLRAGETVYRALHRAQLKLLETHRHPYYWAPFILTGNPALTITG
jgi:CHAT domain-containing protein